MLNLFRNLHVRWKLAVVSSLFVGAAGVTGWMAASTLATVKVGGPLYGEVIQSKDLLADVLPPPEYIVESNLLASQMVLTSDPGARDKLHDRARALEKEFEARHAYWEKTLPDGKNKDLLTTVAYAPAARFYSLLETDLVPALRDGDDAKAREILTGPMAKAYDEHRVAIDQVVSLSTEDAQKTEAAATLTIADSAVRLLSAGAAAVLFIMAVLQLVGRSIANPMQACVAALRKVATGDLTVHLDISTKDEAGQVAEALNTAVAAMSDTVGRARDVAASVSVAADELSAAARDISTAAQEQASTLEETAASLEEVAGASKETAASAQRATGLAGDSRTAAENGGVVVGAAVKAMGEIDGAARRIGDIIGAIDEIAFQTNLLALNAAVEAARAGDQGRGFAVVAGEVRALSLRSASASKEVKSLVKDSLAKIESGGTEIQRSGHALEGIVSSAQRVTETIDGIANAVREQDVGIEQVTRAITQLDQATQSSAAQTEELSATAEQLALRSAELQQIVARFRIAGSSGEAEPEAAEPMAAAAARRPVPSRGKRRASLHAASAAG